MLLIVDIMFIEVITIYNSYFFIKRKHFGSNISMILMTVSAILRIIYFSKRDVSAPDLIFELIFPIFAAIIFVIAICIFGEQRPEISFIPVLMGVIFFIYKSLKFDSRIHTSLCIVLYIAVAIIFGITIFGLIKFKYLLYPLFGLPLIYHIFIEDMKLYVFADPPVPYFEWLPEISVLCIISSLLFLSFSIKKLS